MSIDDIEELLKTRTVEQIANGLGITKNALQCRLKSNGVDVRQIKDDYAVETITKMINLGYTCARIASESGFCIRKVKQYTKRIRG